MNSTESTIAGTGDTGDAQAACRSKKSLAFVPSVLRIAIAGGECFLAVALLKGAFAHVANPYQFLAAVLRYELGSVQQAELAATVIPFAELVLGAGLISRLLYGSKFFPGIPLASACLLAVFIVAQVSAQMRGLTIGCGCFGSLGSQMVGVESIVLTIFLFWLACCAYFFSGSGWQP